MHMHVRVKANVTSEYKPIGTSCSYIIFLDEFHCHSFEEFT